MATDASSFCYLPIPSAPDQALAALAEPISSWFRQEFETPTLAQRFAWPALGRGENLLLCAPTGTGKTLAAFLPIFSKLWDDPAEGLACLYIAPLKALGRDVGKNLRRYLRSLEDNFRIVAGRKRDSGTNKQRIRVALRTGDTSWIERSRQLLRKPHILLTTPESLAVLLNNPRSSEFFPDLRWVVVDEIHALAGNKRGADLSLSLERLKAIKEEHGAKNSFQRIGLSATCSPIQTAAGFLVGAGRPCTIAQVPDHSPFDLTIEPLPVEEADFCFMARLVNRLESEMAPERTILIFTNIRSIAERLTWVLKHRFSDKKRHIAVHHSSLAPERRRVVERRLKKGRLEVVVTSTSLELGIDIGSVDLVVFVHPPSGVARFLQRLGRSGHQPGRPRRGLLLTSGSAELLEATVTAAAGRSGQLEPLITPVHPLDVLCQHLVGMAMTSWWSPEAAYRLICHAHCYRDLCLGDFDACLAYLSGRHADGRTWLPSRLRWQEGRFAIIDQRTLLLLRRNLGTILNEEPRAIRLLLPNPEGSSMNKNSSIAIGSLDDAYADRLRPGDRLLLDGRCFEYRRREKNAVLVDEVSTRPIVPHWTGSGWSLSRELAQRLFTFRMQAAGILRDGPEALRRWLELEYGLKKSACSEIARLFFLQEMVSEIPDACTLFVETVANDQGFNYYFHTPLNRPGNDAIARTVSWRLFQERGLAPQTVVADLGFLMMLPSNRIIDAQGWRLLFSAQNFDRDLNEVLSDSQSMRERFANVATIGLMVLRNPLGGRRKVGGHDWAQRRLFDQVRDAEPDFVLLRQAEREVRAEVCAADAAREYLLDLPNRHVRCRRLADVSPFAAHWTQTEEMIADPEEVLASLHTEFHTPQFESVP